MTYQLQNPDVKSLMTAALRCRVPASSGSANGAFAASANAAARRRLQAHATMPRNATNVRTVAAMLTML